MSKRISTRAGGKKRGAVIRNTLAVKPLGIKNNRYELDARAAMLAMKHNVQNEQHLIDLYVLADICDRLSGERYIKVHVASVKSLIEKVHKTDKVCHFDYVAMEPSADVLLEFFRHAKNADIARVCLEAAK